MFHFLKTSYLLVLTTFVVFHDSIRTEGKIQRAQIKSDTSGLIANGATLQQISRQFNFTEGPAVDKEGNVFFTDQPNNDIWKWATDGTLSLFKHGTGRSNGLYIDKNGTIIACADEKNRILAITQQKKMFTLYKAPKSRRLNGPNDLWIDAHGGIYITDPYYQRPYWKRKKPALKGQNVYYLPSGKKTLITVETTLKQPNGIVGTPDGKQLFIADIGDGKTYKFDIAADGSLQNKQLFVAQGSDGMTLDERGDLYITGDGVTIYNAAGQKIEHIEVPAKWTSNLCFGGRNKDQLFITASEGVYVIQMKVKGVE